MSLSHEQESSETPNREPLKSAGGNAIVVVIVVVADRHWFFPRFSWINYILMRGYVSARRKGPSRMERYDRGRIFRGIREIPTTRTLPKKAPFTKPLVEAAFVASNYNLAADIALVSFTSTDGGRLLDAFTNVMYLLPYLLNCLPLSMLK